jgi:hypothetical protein
MKLLIAIPSKGRAATIARHTLRYVPALGYDYKVFVEPQEAEAYTAVTDQLVTLDDSDRGLWFAKKAIRRYAETAGYDLIFKMDDDLHYWSPGHGKQADNIEQTPALLQQTIKAVMDKMAADRALRAVGFNYKQFMHVDSVPEWSMGQRLQTTYICHTRSFDGNEAVPVFEDFYTTLSIWMNGGLTARYNRAGFDAGAVGGNSGGLQGFDRAAMAVQAIAGMQQICPVLKVRLTPDKPWPYEPDMAAVARALRRVQ